METPDIVEKRKRMVELQIIPRGITDSATINSMLTVPRHLFVSEHLRDFAYDDTPLKIGFRQVISQPYLVGLMTNAAELGQDSTVLEIGTGSGYAAAVLSQIAREVYTIERIPELAEGAQKVIQELGYKNVHIKIGDGSVGWPEMGPFDAIISTAGTSAIPESFYDQLKPSGRVVIPIGNYHDQYLYCYRKLSDGKYSREFLEYVRFVPLIGKEGWEE